MKYTMMLPLVAAVACSAQPPPTAKVMPAPVVEVWDRQEVVSNIQDWDRMAIRIATGLHANGLVGIGTEPHGRLLISCNGYPCDNASAFLRAFSNALQNAIIQRGGHVGDMKVALTFDVIAWGSRSNMEPDVLRREAVWQAAVEANGKVMSFREPFYIFDSDLGLYVNLPPPPPPTPIPLTAAELLTGTQRPIVFSTTR